MADAVGATPKETDAMTNATGLADALRAEEEARAALMASRLSVGRQIREARDLRGIGLVALAEAACVDAGDLSRLERGRLWQDRLATRAIAALEHLTRKAAA